MKRLSSVIAKFFCYLICFYQKFISPLYPPICRFYPSCSHYALESLKVHGLFKGSFLAVRRLLKCHPFHPGGLDPVPPKTSVESPKGYSAGPKSFRSENEKK